MVIKLVPEQAREEMASIKNILENLSTGLNICIGIANDILSDGSELQYVRQIMDNLQQNKHAIESYEEIHGRQRSALETYIEEMQAATGKLY